MDITEYLKLQKYARDYLDKFYKRRENVENFLKKAGEFRSAEVELAHVNEIIINLEEIENGLSWFIGEE